jgi:hypothetical protein
MMTPLRVSVNCLGGDIAWLLIRLAYQVFGILT